MKKLILAGVFALAACSEAPTAVQVNSGNTLQLVASDAVLEVGERTAVTVVDGTDGPVAATLVSSNPSVVAVQADGTLRALSVGTAVIEARYGGRVATQVVVVEGIKTAEVF